MSEYMISAQRRDELGKGASRRLRRAGKVLGIVYGGDAAPQPIVLEQHILANKLDNEAFFSSILTLDLDGEKEQVVIKDLQRHPYKPFINHIDLLRVSASEKIEMHVPIHFINEESCIGVKQGGGVISHMISEIAVLCLPGDLPEYIELDLGPLDIGDSVHLEDLILPEGVESAVSIHGGDTSQPVVTVHKARVAAEESEEGEGLEGEAAETDEDTTEE